MFSDHKEEVQAEAVESLTKAILEATQRVMLLHGEDPQMPVLVSAAFAYSLEVIGRNDSSIPPTVRVMLEGITHPLKGDATRKH